MVVHSFYRSEDPSGENSVVHDEIESLPTAGVDVVQFTLHSDDEAARSPLQSALSIAEVAVHDKHFTPMLERAKRSQPDVIHVHNTFPWIGGAPYRVSRALGIPVVRTIHNFRDKCISATHYRDGVECFDCVRSGSPLSGVRHRCYRNSTPYSVGAALIQVRTTRRKGVSPRYLALSQYQKDILVSSGMNEDEILVKPNFVSDRGFVEPQGSDVLYMGRLSREKGV